MFCKLIFSNKLGFILETSLFLKVACQCSWLAPGWWHFCQACLSPEWDHFLFMLGVTNLSLHEHWTQWCNLNSLYWLRLCNLSGTNTLAYSARTSMTKKRRFVNFNYWPPFTPSWSGSTTGWPPCWRTSTHTGTRRPCSRCQSYKTLFSTLHALDV